MHGLGKFSKIDLDDISKFPKNYSSIEIREIEKHYREMARLEETIEGKKGPLEKASKLNVIALALEAQFLEEDFESPLTSIESDEIGLSGLMVMGTNSIENIKERTGREYRVAMGAAGIEFKIAALKNGNSNQALREFLEKETARKMRTVNRPLSNYGDKIQRERRFNKVGRLFEAIYGSSTRTSSLLYMGDTQVDKNAFVTIRIPVKGFVLSNSYKTLDISISNPEELIVKIRKNIDPLIKIFHEKLCR